MLEGLSREVRWDAPHVATGALCLANLHSLANSRAGNLTGGRSEKGRQSVAYWRSPSASRGWHISLRERLDELKRDAMYKHNFPKETPSIAIGGGQCIRPSGEDFADIVSGKRVVR